MPPAQSATDPIAKSLEPDAQGRVPMIVGVDDSHDIKAIATTLVSDYGGELDTANDLTPSHMISIRLEPAQQDAIRKIPGVNNVELQHLVTAE